MSVLNNSIVPASGGYEIDNSCRFNDDDTAYLSRTPGSAGNRKTWTWSGWVKRGNLTGFQMQLFDAGASTDHVRFRFVGEYLSLYINQGSTYSIDTTALFRDISTYYHVMVSVDTTQSTASDRVKMYVNGSQITDLTATYPTRYLETQVNSNVFHTIGKRSNSDSQYLDGYLSEVHFIDGQALDHTSFGETDATYGHWKPKQVTGMTYGTNGFYLPFDNTGTIHTITANGDVNHSTSQSKVGGSSIYFDGTGDYLSVPDHDAFNFGSDEFTIESWIRLDDVTGVKGIYTQRIYSGYGAINFFVNGNKLSTVGTYNGSSPWDWNITSTTSLSANIWTHVVLQRSGNELSFWINGTKDSTTATLSGSIYNDSNVVIIGHGNDSGQDFDGYMDEYRVSNAARYTSSFTPSTAFTDDSNTLLLIHSDTTNFSTTFTDSSGVEGELGNDQSGQANHWTTNNLASTDQMLDTPTNNFCTWNPVSNAAGGLAALSEGNLRYNPAGTTSSSGMFGTIGVNSGKWYFEVCRKTAGNGYHTGIAGYSGSTLKNSIVYSGNYYYGDNNTTMGWASPGTSGEIISCAFDLDNNKIWFARNNVWKGGGNPSAGTGQTDTLTSGLTNVSPYTKHGNATYTGDDIHNFGQDSSFAGNKTAQGNADGNGYGDFYYEPPSGFLALCTANLDDPAAGLWSGGKNVNFNTVLYSGTGSAQSITGVDFQPEFVWFKNRSASYHHQLVDINRGVDKTLNSNRTNAEGSIDVTSFDSDGFSITGSSNNLNASGSNYVAWNWKANGSDVLNEDGSIDSQVSANTTAGFSIVSYTGTGSAGTVGHGLSSAPELLIIKTRSNTSPWFVYNEPKGKTYRMYLNQTTGGHNDDLELDNAPGDSTFSFKSSSTTDVNGSGRTYIAYCFHSVDGYSKVGSYTGNGSSDGTFVYTGFRPAYVVVKRTDSTGGWRMTDAKRYDDNGNDWSVLQLDSSASEYDSSDDLNVDFLSTGFKHRGTYSQVNASGGTYIYLAFAEHPFKYSNAR